MEGPLVEAVQNRLTDQGFNAGVADGKWGSHTLNALRNWQQANGITPTGEIDDQTWSGLMTSPIPDLSRRSLQLIWRLGRTGYGGANGNFDGQGITWVSGFTWRNGEL